ncbi:MAG: type 4a pilus biogenesis protein PilO [Syntrophales bacterium]|nr:type 4a pilus biogenesis protein PilO [Syntrophales bacterium]
MALADDFKKMNPKIRMLLAVVIVLLVGVAYWLYLLKPVLDKRGELKTKLAELDGQIAEKERIAAQKNKYLKEIAILKEAFQLALTKLPDEREIPGLLQSISLAGRQTGIRFALFEPKPPEKAPEKPKDKGAEVRANLKPSDQRAEQKQAEQKPAEQKPGDGDKKAPAKAAVPDRFYEEIPVKINVNGLFTGTVKFFDLLANLPRIVNVEDITIAATKDTTEKMPIVGTSCTVKTYMFLEKKAPPPPTAKTAEDKKK